MFDSKNANLIVWVLSAWLALVETVCGQDASSTEQAEPDSGRPLPRAVFIDLPQPIIDDQDPVFPALDRSTAASMHAPSDQNLLTEQFVVANFPGRLSSQHEQTRCL